MSVRKKRSAARLRKTRVPPEWRKIVKSERAFSAAFDTAAALMYQIRSRPPRGMWKPAPSSRY